MVAPKSRGPKIMSVVRRVTRNSQWVEANLGVWGQSLQLPEAGAGTQRSGGRALKNFAFFCKNNLILRLFNKK